MEDDTNMESQANNVHIKVKSLVDVDDDTATDGGRLTILPTDVTL
jgi:hypothetical protein